MSELRHLVVNQKTCTYKNIPDPRRLILYIKELITFNKGYSVYYISKHKFTVYILTSHLSCQHSQRPQQTVSGTGTMTHNFQRNVASPQMTDEDRIK